MQIPKLQMWFLNVLFFKILRFYNKTLFFGKGLNLREIYSEYDCPSPDGRENPFYCAFFGTIKRLE